MTREEVLTWVDTLDGDDACNVCSYNCVCNHTTVSGGPNGPIYAPCCDSNMSEICDYGNAEEAYLDAKCEECTAKDCNGCEHQH